MVAWFVSNCKAKNNRLNYAKRLAKHIQVDRTTHLPHIFLNIKHRRSFQVDIYGTCGSLTCLRKDRECFDMLKKDYKFYLAFENSNCKEYITEKFFSNGLRHNILPIVMGASVEDYKAVAPPNSFLHVDQFKNPAHLAKYLKMLDKDDKMYNKFFDWQSQGEWVNTKFFCRVCSMLHFHKEERIRSSNVVKSGWDQWWQGEGVCRK